MEAICWFETQALSELQGVTTKKTVFFKVTAMITSKPADVWFITRF
jgi:hypothetical protein